MKLKYAPAFLASLVLACSSPRPATPASTAVPSGKSTAETAAPTTASTTADKASVASSVSKSGTNIPIAAAGQKTDQIDPSVTLQAPFVLALEGPKTVTAGSEIDVRLRITVNRPIRGTLNLSASIPAGATLVSGNGTEAFTNPSEGVTERSLRLRLAEVPADDLLVKLSYRSASSGASAKRRYTFGRSKAKRPIPRNRVIKGVGGVRLGAPVPLKRKTLSPAVPKP